MAVEVVRKIEWLVRAEENGWRRMEAERKPFEFTIDLENRDSRQMLEYDSKH